ncbi:hypothetical protein AHAS_Ahas13G0400000 [Arachis hypogaea]
MLRLQAIVTDGSGCLNLFVWNKEAEQLLNITYKNINAVEGVYNIIKLSGDESLMSSYGVANSSCDASMLANTPIAKTEEDNNGHAAVSLSNDSTFESNDDSSYQTPAKRTSPDAATDSTA